MKSDGLTYDKKLSFEAESTDQLAKDEDQEEKEETMENQMSAIEDDKLLKQPFDNWRNLGSEKTTIKKTRTYRSQKSILNRQVNFKSFLHQKRKILMYNQNFVSCL